MKKMEPGIVIALEVIVIGLLWLLNALRVGETIDWLLLVAPGGLGILALLLFGWNKLTGVVGPFLVVYSVYDYLVVMALAPARGMWSVLLIVLGILLIAVFSIPGADSAADGKSGRTLIQRKES